MNFCKTTQCTFYKQIFSNVSNIYIVACRQGMVSNKPPGFQTVTRHGARDPLVPFTLFFLVSSPPPLRISNGLALRKDEPGTSQYNTIMMGGWHNMKIEQYNSDWVCTLGGAYVLYMYCTCCYCWCCRPVLNWEN